VSVAFICVDGTIPKMIGPLGSTYFHLYRPSRTCHSQIYNDHDSNEVPPNLSSAQTSLQSSIYQIKSLQTSFRSNDVDELDDDEYGGDDRYKNRSECEYGTESKREVVDIGSQDQYEDGTWERK